MIHLSLNEIIAFVSIDELSQESIALATKVNAHILTCDSCRRSVELFQEAYDSVAKEENKEAFVHAKDRTIHGMIQRKKTRLTDYLDM